MKKYPLYYFVVISIFLMISCATTKISSFANPKIKISAYNKILVVGNVKDIDFRKTLEKELVEAFIASGKKAESSINLISPLKEYSDQELKKIYDDNEIDSILSVALITSSEETSYIPQQTQTNYRSQYINGQLISVPYTTTSGGYSVSHPKASFEILLVDEKTGDLALKATANSEGDEFSDMKTISKSLSKEIVKEFLAQP